MICNIHDYKKMVCHGKVEVNEEHDTLAFIVSLMLVKSCEISGLLLKAKKFKRPKVLHDLKW